MLLKKIFFTIICVFFLILTSGQPSYSQTPSPSGSPSVDVEIGPTFDKDLESQKKPWFDCLFAAAGSRFPFDFVGSDFAVSDLDGGCPQLEIFKNKYSGCFLLDVYEKIRPAVLGGLMIYGIFHL